MRIVSWNINGLLSALESDCFKAIADLKPDLVCIQEIRTNDEPTILNKYRHFWNHCDRNKYSGTALLSAKQPLNVTNGFIGDFEDNEGRIITAELDKAFLVNVYVPNSQQNLKRHDYRIKWDAALREHITELMYKKPVIVCGDFNTVRGELDVFEENMRQFWKMQGFISDERSDFESLLELGLKDVFRELYPDSRSYTWWSNRLNKRQENRGWRIDFFLASEELMDNIIDIKHLSEITGSDHCPIMLEVKL